MSTSFFDSLANREGPAPNVPATPALFESPRVGDDTFFQRMADRMGFESEARRQAAMNALPTSEEQAAYLQKRDALKTRSMAIFVCFLALFFVIAGVILTSIFIFTDENKIDPAAVSASKSLASISAIFGIGAVTATAHRSLEVEHGVDMPTRTPDSLNRARVNTKWLLIFTSLGFVFLAIPLILMGVYVISPGMDSSSNMVASDDQMAFMGLFVTAAATTFFGLVFWFVLLAVVAQQDEGKWIREALFSAGMKSRM